MYCWMNANEEWQNELSDPKNKLPTGLQHVDWHRPETSRQQNDKCLGTDFFLLSFQLYNLRFEYNQFFSSFFFTLFKLLFIFVPEGSIMLFFSWKNRAKISSFSNKILYTLHTKIWLNCIFFFHSITWRNAKNAVKNRAEIRYSADFRAGA